MSSNVAKFSIGDVVKHKHFDFRGVIYDVDFEFNSSEEWYRSIPKDVRPRKNQPFYHLLLQDPGKLTSSLLGFHQTGEHLFQKCRGVVLHIYG